MIAPIRKSAPTQPTWHATFLAMLPIIRSYARFAFRHFGTEAREEAIEEVIANSLSAFVRLVAIGKTDVAYPSVLAKFAIRQVRAGRRVGGRVRTRDVMSPAARPARGVIIERLDQFDEFDGEWQEVLVEDKKAGPAETAAGRIDVAAWFGSLDRNKRRIAKILARGETTGTVAQMFRLSAGRVSQLRRELAKSWEEFQGPMVPA